MGRISRVKPKNKKKRTRKTKRRYKSHRKNKSIDLTPGDEKLLKSLTQIHSPSHDEHRIRDFILNHIQKNKSTWKYKPTVHYGDKYGNNILLVFGKPTLAVFSHMDSVGFTVGQNRELFPIGGVEYKDKQAIRGYDEKDRPLKTHIVKNKYNYKHSVKDKIPIGTTLTYVPTWKKKYNTIKTTSIDDRVGLFMCLILAKTLKNGILIFSCGEEIESGNVPFLVRFIHEKYNIRNTVVLDVTSEHQKINILMKHGPVI